MANTKATNREGFHLLLELCKDLKIKIIFGFPKSLNEHTGAYLFYGGKGYTSKIYLPKRSRTHYSNKYNAMLAHEIGHYFVLQFNISIDNISDKFFDIAEFCEEVLAWSIATHIIKICNIGMDKEFALAMKESLDSYLDDLYANFDQCIINLITPIYSDMVKDNEKK